MDEFGILDVRENTTNQRDRRPDYPISRIIPRGHCAVYPVFTKKALWVAPRITLSSQTSPARKELTINQGTAPCPFFLP
jgi:hypothetical protein